MRILIADDERDFVEMLEDWLNYKNIKMDIAYEGMEALRFLKSGEYEVVILDHNMPGLTGLELIEYVKEKGLKCKTVMVTGYEEMDEVIAKAAGADEYLTKPVKMQEIRNIIEKYEKEE